MTKADKEGQRKTPILRFKGFTDDWEQRKLNDFGTFHKGKGFSKNGVSSLNGTPVILYGMLYTDFKTHYSVNNISSYINEFDEKNTIFSSGNEIIFPSSGETAVDIARSAAVQDSGIIIGGDLIILKVNSNTELKFIPLIFLNQKYKRKVASLAQGKSIVHIHTNDLKNLEILLPQKSEQTKISNLINYIEKLLALYERKIKLLSQMKKYFLDNLFAKREYPNLRFKGFTDTWEQRQLNEVADVVSGGTPATDFSEYWNGNINWFTPNEINSQIYFSESKRKISNLGLKKSSAKLLPANRSILFTSRATIGEMGILTQDATTNQGFQSLVLHNEVIPYFIFSMKSTLKRQAIKKASGSTFLEISKREVEKLKIVIPSEKEQKKVSMLFKGIDNLFTLYKNKQQHLTEIKKTLLNTMFI